MNDALIKAVRKQMGGTKRDQDKIFDQLADGTASVDDGIQGFIDEDELTKFHDKNEVLIWELLRNLADDSGESIMTLLERSKFAPDVTELAGFKHMLSLIALEEIANQVGYVYDGRG